MQGVERVAAPGGLNPNEATLSEKPRNSLVWQCKIGASGENELTFSAKTRRMLCGERATSYLWLEAPQDRCLVQQRLIEEEETMKLLAPRSRILRQQPLFC
jgi:hypothetical protein